MTQADLLVSIYRAALEACEPSDLLRSNVTDIPPLFRTSVVVVAIGKAAASLYRGATGLFDIDRALVVVPLSYPTPEPAGNLGVLIGGHPAMTESSFRAGESLFNFVSTSSRPVVFLVSGGSSACVELSLGPWFDDKTVAALNGVLVRSGLPIASINIVRKHVSALKGGRLAAATTQPVLTLVYSDVAAGDLASVGSGPTIADSTTNDDAASVLDSISGAGEPLPAAAAETLRKPNLPDTPSALSHVTNRLVADSRTLVETAARIARRSVEHCVVLKDDLDGDVEQAAARLGAELSRVPTGTLLVTGGEPTVKVRGSGRGGRCSELAVRLVREARSSGFSFCGLFAGSDGVDGNSGAAGVVVSSGGAGFSAEEIARAIEQSDTFPLAARMGEPIVQDGTGNNLRDLVLIIRN